LGINANQTYTSRRWQFCPILSLTVVKMEKPLAAAQKNKKKRTFDKYCFSQERGVLKKYEN